MTVYCLSTVMVPVSKLARTVGAFLVAVFGPNRVLAGAERDVQIDSVCRPHAGRPHVLAVCIHVHAFEGRDDGNPGFLRQCGCREAEYKNHPGYNSVSHVIPLCAVWSVIPAETAAVTLSLGCH